MPPRLRWVWLTALAIATLAGCAPSPEPAKPAFWQVSGPHGEKGWLLGTIHALPRPVAWRSPAIGAALDQANVVAVEIANLDDTATMAELFDKLEHSPGLPPLSVRVDPALRGALVQQLAAAHVTEADFAKTETWSVALRLARASDGENDSANGVDRAVLRAANGKRVVELEGAAGQLGMFDAMPEAEQRAMLDAVLREAGQSEAGQSEDSDLANAWRKGNFAAIEAETRRGMLADPALRETLFTARNRAWTQQLAARLSRGERVFVAVGAAHMAGPDGLGAMLAAKGFQVERVQ
ncbi:MAG: TraB/GumN family protein [Novosphingobium sp.]